MSKPSRRESDIEYLKRRVDAMIDYTGDAETRKIGSVIQVYAFKSDLTFAMEVGGKMHYRGYILDPVNKRTPTKKKHAAATQLDIDAATMYRGKQ